MINFTKYCFVDIIKILPSKEAQIIIMRQGTIDGVSHTLEEVGRVFGVTRERVRQIEARAHEKLRLRLSIHREKYA